MYVMYDDLQWFTVDLSGDFFSRNGNLTKKTGDI